MPLSKSNTTKQITGGKRLVRRASVYIFFVFLFVAISAIAGFAVLEARYEGRVYPNVFIGGIPFGGKMPEDIETYWRTQNEPYTWAVFELQFGDAVATISGTDLELGYDATLSATQAYVVGRSNFFFSNLFIKLFRQPVYLTPYFRWKDDVLINALSPLAARIDVPVQNALFQYDNGKVTAFRPSRDGKRVNVAEAKIRFAQSLATIPTAPSRLVPIPVPVEIIKPSVTTENANSLGVKELIGRGYSEFRGSIPGRIHNIVLAANRLNGVLIKPGEILSFNDVVGDISAATGYQSAYIIKDGRTVLGDGGGVCQVSTTLFRAALAAGLPIVERRAHAYRVHYYEEGGYKPGIDATVFAPSVDLKIKNDTAGYILIQTKTDTKNLTLTFELYGTDDGRRAEIFNHNVWNVVPPPPDLYQDDPTLPKGTTKQVDFAAWGASTSFQYKVTRGGEVLQDTKFVSNFRPWQAVYLRGPQQ